MKTQHAAALVVFTLVVSLPLPGVWPALSHAAELPSYEPAVHLAPRSDIPLPDDAEVVFFTPEFVIFHTAAGVDEVVDFYKQRMPEQGWESFTVTLQIQDVGCQSYIKGDEAAYLLITPGPTNTAVMIRVTGVTEPWRMPERDDETSPTATPVPTLPPSPESTPELRLIRGVPLLPDGIVDFSSPDFIGYHTYATVENAGRFYEREMPAREWKPAPDNSIAADAATLTYTQGVRSVSIIIYPGDGEKTYLLITLGAGD
jgi:hypothetical protein